MKMIILERNPELGKSLCYLLISFGIKGIPVCSREAALDACKWDAEIGMGIIDVDNKEVEGTQFIEEIKKIRHEKNFKIILHSASSMENIKENLVGPGIVGFIPKPFDEDATFNHIKNILSKIYFTGKEKRSHIRVKPDPDELLRVHFRCKLYSGLLFGRIININLNGIAIELLKSPSHEILKEGTPLPKIQFNLDYKEITAQGIIILERGMIIVVRFLSLSKRAKNIIARYIFKRISE
jgi:CheY-like chemotaxis protein